MSNFWRIITIRNTTNKLVLEAPLGFLMIVQIDELICLSFHHLILKTGNDNHEVLQYISYLTAAYNLNNAYWLHVVY